MLFSEIATYFNKIEEIKSRLEITDVLVELFESISTSEIKRTIYLIQGQIAPTFKGQEIGFGEKMIAEGLAKATGYTRKEVDKLFTQIGDFGEVAEKLVKERKQGALFSNPLTIEKVFFNLERMSNEEGKGSQELKKKILAELFNSASPIEAKYIARIPLGNIRLGIGDPTIMDAFAIILAKENNKNWQELNDDEKRKIKVEFREKIEGAYNVFSDLGTICELIKENGAKGLEKIKLSPGTPIRPTAAERLPSSKEIIEKLGKCAVEAKYDGFRVQLSKNGDDIKIFSRQSEDITPMFPELIEAAKKQLPKSCIVEGEALAVNQDSNEYYPFQITIQRKRKYDIEKKSKEYPLKLFLFDVVFVDGKNYMNQTYLERREKLESIIKKDDNQIITLSEMKLIDNPKDLEDFFEEKIAQGLEGIIAKDLNAPYIAGARKYAWIKLKRSYKGSLEDTVDLTIIGYYDGKGKRTQFGIGAVLAATYNKENDTFESIAKIGTGMTEEVLKELEDLLSKLKTKKKPVNVLSEFEPDYYVNPKIVIEVRADEITLSKTHSCNKAELGEKAFALRFPRMIKFRMDKKPTDSTTNLEIKKMYENQKRVQLTEFNNN